MNEYEVVLTDDKRTIVRADRFDRSGGHYDFYIGSGDDEQMVTSIAIPEIKQVNLLSPEE